MDVPYKPEVWRSDGSWDWKKIAAGVTRMNISYMKHRAYHGGGVFIRLEDDLSGAFIEEPSDPGSTDGALQTIATGIADSDIIFNRHSIDNIVKALENVSLQHPDLFNEIDKAQHITWNDAVSVPSLAVQPITAKVERILDTGTIVGIGRTDKPYAPFQIVRPEDVIPSSIVDVRGMEGVIRQRLKRISNKRKRNLGDYHGYL